MDFNTLKKMVRQGEGQTIEFKKKAKFPEKIMKEVVAFANSNGGYLFIGIDDNKTISGVKFAEDEKHVLSRAIDAYCNPKINYTLTEIPVENKRTVLAYHIPKGSTPPYLVVQQPGNNQGKVYVRVADRSVQASKEVRQILRKGNNLTGQAIHYGEKERILMHHFANNTYITLSQYVKLSQLPRWLAGKTLVRMVLANVLRVEPNENEDRFIPLTLEH